MAILPTRATLLATRIGALRGWGLIIGCGCRGFPRHMPIDRIADLYGSRPTLEAVLQKLRCERCRRPPQSVDARQGDPFAVRGSPRIALLESRNVVQRR